MSVQGLGKATGMVGILGLATEKEPFPPPRDQGREKLLERRGRAVWRRLPTGVVASGTRKQPTIQEDRQMGEYPGLTLYLWPGPLTGGYCWELNSQESPSTPSIEASLWEHGAGWRGVESGPGGANGNDPAQFVYSWKFPHPPLEKTSLFYQERVISPQGTVFNSLQ